MDKIKLSSDRAFYTVEGEGLWVGRPSVFLRLAHCNLTCKGWATPDSPHGCDSFLAWSKPTTFWVNEVIDLLKPWETKLSSRFAILKVTGGEPLLQQKGLQTLFDRLEDWGRLHIDFETNGTVMPKWERVFHQITYTCSPKLSTNGDPVEKTYQPDVLRKLRETGRTIFKFGVTCEEDLDEIEEKYVTALHISKKYIWLMPVCGSRQEHSDRCAAVAEWCKERSFNFSPRLQLVIWDKALGV